MYAVLMNKSGYTNKPQVTYDNCICPSAASEINIITRNVRLGIRMNFKGT